MTSQARYAAQYLWQRVRLWFAVLFLCAIIFLFVLPNKDAFVDAFKIGAEDIVGVVGSGNDGDVVLEAPPIVKQGQSSLNGVEIYATEIEDEEMTIIATTETETPFNLTETPEPVPVFKPIANLDVHPRFGTVDDSTLINKPRWIVENNPDRYSTQEAVPPPKSITTETTLAADRTAEIIIQCSVTGDVRCSKLRDRMNQLTTFATVTQANDLITGTLNYGKGLYWYGEQNDTIFSIQPALLGYRWQFRDPESEIDRKDAEAALIFIDGPANPSDVTNAVTVSRLCNELYLSSNRVCPDITFKLSSGATLVVRGPDGESKSSSGSPISTPLPNKQLVEMTFRQSLYNFLGLDDVFPIGTLANDQNLYRNQPSPRRVDEALEEFKEFKSRLNFGSKWEARVGEAISERGDGGSRRVLEEIETIPTPTHYNTNHIPEAPVPVEPHPEEVEVTVPPISYTPEAPVPVDAVPEEVQVTVPPISYTPETPVPVEPVPEEVQVTVPPISYTPEAPVPVVPHSEEVQVPIGDTPLLVVSSTTQREFPVEGPLVEIFEDVDSLLDKAKVVVANTNVKDLIPSHPLVNTLHHLEPMKPIQWDYEYLSDENVSGGENKYVSYVNQLLYDRDFVAHFAEEYIRQVKEQYRKYMFDNPDANAIDVDKFVNSLISDMGDLGQFVERYVENAVGGNMTWVTVLTKVDDTETRNQWRETMKKYQQNGFRNLKLVFPLQVHADYDVVSGEYLLDEQHILHAGSLSHESDEVEFHTVAEVHATALPIDFTSPDIIAVPGNDSYETLNIKTSSVLQMANRFNASIIKIDDDMAIHPPGYSLQALFADLCAYSYSNGIMEEGKYADTMRGHTRLEKLDVLIRKSKLYYWFYEGGDAGSIYERSHSSFPLQPDSAYHQSGYPLCRALHMFQNDHPIHDVGAYSEIFPQKGKYRYLFGDKWFLAMEGVYEDDAAQITDPLMDNQNGYNDPSMDAFTTKRSLVGLLSEQQASGDESVRDMATDRMKMYRSELVSELDESVNHILGLREYPTYDISASRTHVSTALTSLNSPFVRLCDMGYTHVGCNKLDVYLPMIWGGQDMLYQSIHFNHRNADYYWRQYEGSHTVFGQPVDFDNSNDETPHRPNKYTFLDETVPRALSAITGVPYHPISRQMAACTTHWPTDSQFKQLHRQNDPSVSLDDSPLTIPVGNRCPPPPISGFGSLKNEYPIRYDGEMFPPYLSGPSYYIHRAAVFIASSNQTKNIGIGPNDDQSAKLGGWHSEGDMISPPITATDPFYGHTGVASFNEDALIGILMEHLVDSHSIKVATFSGSHDSHHICGGEKSVWRRGKLISPSLVSVDALPPTHLPLTPVEQNNNTNGNFIFPESSMPYTVRNGSSVRFGDMFSSKYMLRDETTYERARRTFAVYPPDVYEPDVALTITDLRGLDLPADGDERGVLPGSFDARALVWDRPDRITEVTEGGGKYGLMRIPSLKSKIQFSPVTTAVIPNIVGYKPEDDTSPVDDYRGIENLCTCRFCATPGSLQNFDMDKLRSKCLEEHIKYSVIPKEFDVSY